tara:strand:+ start:348 stop:515 length:168 start_codon:yes stop_codon:yes gene_type:complete
MLLDREKDTQQEGRPIKPVLVSRLSHFLPKIWPFDGCSCHHIFYWLPLFHNDGQS